MIACILLAWLKLIALDGDLAKAEPKTLHYRLMHAAARVGVTADRGAQQAAGPDFGRRDPSGLRERLPAQPQVSRVLTLHSPGFRIITNGMPSGR